MGKTNPIQRRSAIDPAVADLLGSLEQRADERSLPIDERKRKRKEREKARARNRVMLDLPPLIGARVKQLAEQHECPISQITALLIW
jgi:hypothetical protein